MKPMPPCPTVLGDVREAGTPRRWTLLGFFLTIASLLGCGEESEPESVAAFATQNLRLFHEPASAAVGVELERLRTESGAPLASWDFAQATDLAPFEVQGARAPVALRDGRLLIPAQAADRPRSLALRPGLDLPPVFAVTIEFGAGPGGGALPSAMYWTSERHPVPTSRRRVSPEQKASGSPASRSVTFEAVYWHGPIESLFFDLERGRGPLAIERITIQSLGLRTLDLDSGGRLRAELAGTAMSAVWARAPARVATVVDVPAGARLEFSTAIAAEDCTADAAETTFLVSVEGEQVFRESVRPGEPARWRPASVDFGPFAGHSVEVALSTEVDGDGRAPLALWGAPRLVAAAPEDESAAIVLVVLDTTRADHLSLYGYELPTTPFLEELGQGAVVFDSAISQAPWTMPSVSSMLTSFEPWELNAVWGTPGGIPEEFPTLAQSLAAAGYRSAAFVGNPVLAPDRGFDRGFDSYTYPRSEMTEGGDLTRRALEWAAAQPRERLFLYVHYIDPHRPYAPPAAALELTTTAGLSPHPPGTPRRFPPTTRAEAEVLMRDYDRELRWLDEQLRVLYEGLVTELGRAPLFVVASDHGEAFLEHGFYTHSASNHAEQVHVPLVFSWPGVLEPRRVEQVVRNLDIVPTLLDLLEVPAPAARGISLRPVMDGVELPLEAYSETNSHGPRRASVRNDRFTYMVFDAWDPFEVPDPHANPAIARLLREHLSERALFERGTSEPEVQDVLAQHPDVADALQRAVDRVEARRHPGFVIRMRGPRSSGAASASLRGVLSIAEGRLVSQRTRRAERGQDEFRLNAGGAGLEFSVELPSGDEELLLFETTPRSSKLLLRLEPQGPALSLRLGPAEVARFDGELKIEAAAATTSWADVEAHMDDDPEGALVQIWKLDHVPAYQRTDTIPAEVLERLRALGYVGPETDD